MTRLYSLHMAQGRDDNPEFDWNAYLGGLAHELKNPLSTINVNLQLLREDWAAEKGGLADRSVTKIDVILDESRRLERMLRDFLRLTSAGRLEVGDLDLNEVLQDVLAFMAAEMRTRNVTASVHIDRSLPLMPTDENLIRQAFINVIKNAADAMEDGGIITISTRREAEDAIIEVIDTGTGMSASTRAQAFNAYFSTKSDGTGLGLPMVRRIIERHGGAVQCDSEPGFGTRFVIRLPLPAGESA